MKLAIFGKYNFNNDAMNLNFYIIDAARILGRMDEVFAFKLSYECLYQGQSRDNLADYAPYLIDLHSSNDGFPEWLSENSKGQSWGIYIGTVRNFEEIYKHLRKFLIVQDEDGKELYFRYYDPRVLRIFLPTCDSEQLKEFFGPIDYFLCEDEDPNYYLKFSLINNELVTERFLLSDIEIANKSSDNNDNLLNEVVNDVDLDNIV